MVDYCTLSVAQRNSPSQLSYCPAGHVSIFSNSNNYVIKQRCVTEKYPDYACLSTDTNNLKGNMFRNALQIPRTETVKFYRNQPPELFYIYQWRLPTESNLFIRCFTHFTLKSFTWLLPWTLPEEYKFHNGKRRYDLY